MKFRTLIAFVITLVMAFTLAACGGARSASGTDVVVSGTGPTDTVTAGDTVVFTMTVANTGDKTATDVVIADGLRTANLVSIACAVTGGATCPAVLSTNMNVPSLPTGSALVFTVTGTVEAGANLPVVNTMTATIADDINRVDNTFSVQVNASTAAAAGFGVTQTGSATVAAGGNAVFKATVTNPGPGAVTNVTIDWAPTAAFDTSSITVECTAIGTSVCPTTLGTSMTTASLDAGRSLIFTFTVAVAADSRGPLTSTVTVAADGDTSPSNNVSTFVSNAVDGRSGTYKAYAADGLLYDLAIDFDANTYTMSGNGQSVQHSFAADPSGNGDFNVAGATATTKFRTSTDLIVGAHDFGHGNLPYVAARTFGTTVNEMTGAYDLMSRNVSADGSTAQTRPATARASGNVLTVCEVPTLVEPTTGCESGYLKNFIVTVTGDLYTGVEAITGEVYSFRIASSGASRILLSSTTLTDTTQPYKQQFRIGVTDAASLAGGTVRGASSTGDWVNIVLTPTTYLFNGIVQTAGDDAALLPVSNAGPFALLQGTRRTDGLTIYVMQAIPLAVVIDAPTTAAGLMQIALP